ncbi:MAG: mannose-1-phosphate guanylyltransferase/mannose-6-phosphate isomerase [Rhodospirillales bacterium]
MQMTLQPVILSGGAGARLWPVSRESRPKQYLRLTSNHTIFQETLLRVADSARFAPPIIVASEDHQFLLAEQVREIGVTPRAVALEPVARNTAPAVATAALLVAEREPDTVMLVLPSDHAIAGYDEFHSAIDKAAELARMGRIVTFGIRPTAPHSGYGYIHRGPELEAVPGTYAVDRFIEKPPQHAANALFSQEGWYWNSGIFVFTARVFLAELGRAKPLILSSVGAAARNRVCDAGFVRLDRDKFARIPALSIDHAVMENTKEAAMIPAMFAWNDIGSWNALWQFASKDESGNAVIGDVILADVADSYIKADGISVAALALKGVAIVATKDAVLVVDRTQAERVKEIADRLRIPDHQADRHHEEVAQRWGSYRVIGATMHTKTRRLIVNPGAEFSLQDGHDNFTHWIVIKGTARAACGRKRLLLQENESISISPRLGCQLENPSSMPLQIIEVQVTSDDVNDGNAHAIARKLPKSDI